MQALTTASDTTTKLDATYENRLIAIGSGVMQTYNLGDASAYGVLKRFEIENATPEFIGVHSNHATPSSASVWKRIPPRARAVFVCLDPTTTGGAGGGEKEGTWFAHVAESRNPRESTVLVEDFLGRAASNIIYGNAGAWNSQLDGSYGSIAMGSAGAGGTAGYVSQTTGTNVAGYAHSTITGVDLSTIGAAKEYEQRFAVNAISDGSQNFIMRLGFHNGASGAAPTVGAYLLADYSVSTSFYVQAKIINAGGNDVDLSAAAPAVYSGGNAWTRGRIEIDSGNTRMDAWIDNVQITASGGLVGYMPNATTNIAFGLSKTLGNTARILYSDYLRVGLHYTTPR